MAPAESGLSTRDQAQVLDELDGRLGEAEGYLRIEAARALAGPAEMQMSDADRAAFRAALAEYVDVQRYNADRAEGHMNLALLELRRGNGLLADAPLTRAIAVDYGAENIRCNTISPGYVLNRVRDADISDERRLRYEGMHVTRLGVADDIAHAAVYLACKESEYLTGINLQLDGGGSIARGLVLG